MKDTRLEVGMKVCGIIRIVYYSVLRQQDKSVQPFLSTGIPFQAVCLQLKPPTKTTESNNEQTESRTECRIRKSGGL
jgi:hypothetical protein